MKGVPLGYLDAMGERAGAVLPLTWFTLIVSIAVCVIIAILLWLGIRRARPAQDVPWSFPMPVQRGGSGLRWIGIGIAISAAPLLVTLVWTMVTLAATAAPPPNPALVLDVTGHQWWWEVRYHASQPSQSFVTANEIHIPVGQRVRIRLHGGDVIHSFWVPKLTGKTDLIPGQTNETWLQARQAGRYRGQCTEYCGEQHAHMALDVVAQPAEEFERWRVAQLAPAPAPTTPEQRRGLEMVEYRCGLCHRVGGTTAAAIAAPDLTHIGDRAMLAAGTLPNLPGPLAGWIENPQALKPGSLMPNQGLSGTQLSDVLAYLGTLK